MSKTKYSIIKMKMNDEIREKIKELEKNSFISLGTWGASSEGSGNSKLIIIENVLYKYSYNFSILDNESKEEETISEQIEITKEKFSIYLVILLFLMLDIML